MEVDYDLVARKVECYARERSRFKTLYDLVKTTDNDRANCLIMDYAIMCCKEYQQYDKHSYTLDVLDRVFNSLKSDLLGG